MITETMTVHEALSSLKTLDARIIKEVNRAGFTMSQDARRPHHQGGQPGRLYHSSQGVRKQNQWRAARR